MTPVESEALHSVGYDPATQTLRVKFKHGGTYEYPNVTPEKHQAMMGAESHGKHFQKHIRPHHAGTKVG